MADKKYLSKIVKGSDTLWIKDAEAQASIEDIYSKISGGLHYLGKSTTPIADGDATGPWVIDGVTYVVSGAVDPQKNLAAGDIVIYGFPQYWRADAHPLIRSCCSPSANPDADTGIYSDREFNIKVLPTVANTTVCKIVSAEWSLTRSINAFAIYASTCHCHLITCNTHKDGYISIWRATTSS